MVLIRLLKPGLFIYECVRIMVIAAYAVLLGRNHIDFPVIFFAAPAVLFPLMALFIWLDIYRYKTYLPLFISGKCIGIFSLLGWLIISRQVTMFTELFGNTVIEMILLSGDFFATAAILLIAKNVKNITETTSLEDS